MAGDLAVPATGQLEAGDWVVQDTVLEVEDLAVEVLGAAGSELEAREPEVLAAQVAGPGEAVSVRAWEGCRRAVWTQADLGDPVVADSMAGLGATVVSEAVAQVVAVREPGTRAASAGAPGQGRWEEAISPATVMATVFPVRPRVPAS